KIIAALILAAGLATASLGVLGWKGDPHREESVAQAAQSIKEPRPEKYGQKTDAFGDPLPEGAISRLGTHRFWCGSTAIQVAYSLDGKRILVADWRSVHIIDAATGKQLRRICPAGDAGVTSMSLSPDGKLLAVGVNSHAKETESSIQIFDTGN